ncbi:purine-binding chemotaxis protein CheW [Granulicella pectinivorans]|jgi:purine-binding chemotaxis protein CheW|uniref:Purine-binding chemotaxis protein CheW n=1 Tax=Granulicella pectinivorans TaxID=474950 RepID=A0A1I6LY69_9BACT|nr:chemotaxis protein CheW [Granulicella pectinivorans]SFS08387.1 purine-binding chemotaxis protein CheW [Granulicella pectinivorans]
MMQFSTFRVGERLLGLDIRMIQEINRIPEITPLPLSAEYVRGFINLRGQIVTLFDLGVRLGLPRKQIDDESHNIILHPRAGARAQDPVGLLADGIGDVVEVDVSQIEPLPANVGEMDGRYLSGVIKFQDELMVLFDLKRVLHID